MMDAAKGVDPPVNNKGIMAKWQKLTHGVIEDPRRDEIERTVLGLDKVQGVEELTTLLEGMQSARSLLVGARSCRREAV